MAVIANPPSPTSNSYVSNADAIAIWSSDPYKQDYPSDVARQDLVLISATNAINDLYQTQFIGTIADADNALYWPRNNVPNPRTGIDFPTDAYPDILARAAALYAYYIDKSNRNTEIQPIQQGPVIEQTLEGVGTQRFASPTTVPIQRMSTVPPEVSRIIAPLISGSSGQGFSTSVMSRG